MHPSPRITGRPAFLFDADCGVCDNGTAAIKDRVKPPVDIVAWQEVDLQEWGVPENAVHEGPVFVAPNGSLWIGPVGMGQMLSLAKAPYRWVGAVMLAPGVRHLLERIGPWMYAHRNRLPGAGDSCTMAAQRAR